MNNLKSLFNEADKPKKKKKKEHRAVKQYNEEIAIC